MSHDNIRRDLLEMLLSLAFLAIDIIFLWPYSHVLALWIAVGITAVTICLLLPLRLGITIALLVIVLGFIAQPNLPPTETEFHGWLTPGYEKMIPSNCPHQPPEAWRVYAGKEQVYFLRSNKLIIVAIGNQPRLWIDKTAEGVAVSGDVADENGVVVRLDKNEFTRSQTNSFRMDHGRHDLTIYNRFDKPVLTVKYLNASAIYLVGILKYPEGPFIRITDNSFECRSAIGGGGVTVNGSCSVNLLNDPYTVCSL